MHHADTRDLAAFPLQPDEFDAARVAARTEALAASKKLAGRPAFAPVGPRILRHAAGATDDAGAAAAAAAAEVRGQDVCAAVAARTPNLRHHAAPRRRRCTCLIASAGGSEATRHRQGREERQAAIQPVLALRPRPVQQARRVHASGATSGAAGAGRKGSRRGHGQDGGWRPAVVAVVRRAGPPVAAGHIRGAPAKKHCSIQCDILERGCEQRGGRSRMMISLCRRCGTST